MRELLERASITHVAPAAIVYVQQHRPMQRLLSFTGRSIDDVVNCAIARRHVMLYYRVGKQIERLAQTAELEAQWNSLGRSNAR